MSKRVRILGLLALSWALACGGGRTAPSTPCLQTAEPSPPTPSGSFGTWDGGLFPSTPGVVRCGASVCPQGEKCCMRPEGSPADIGCDAKANSACLHMGDDRTCDETADCGPGELCCVYMTSIPVPTLNGYCHNSLTASPVTACQDESEFIACGSDDDCRAVGALPCVAQICRGEVVQTCGRPPSYWCAP